MNPWRTLILRETRDQAETAMVYAIDRGKAISGNAFTGGPSEHAYDCWMSDTTYLVRAFFGRLAARRFASPCYIADTQARMQHRLDQLRLLRDRWSAK